MSLRSGSAGAGCLENGAVNVADNQANRLFVIDLPPL